MENSQIEEKLDVVDEQDLVLGSATRTEIHDQGLLHREVHVWLFDEDKNIFFQTRGASKSTPGILDSTIGGHVDLGEDYIGAAIRETREESGVQVKETDLLLVQKLREHYTYPNKNKTNNFFRAIFLCTQPVKEANLVFDPQESFGFKKFSLEYLENVSLEDYPKFHKYILTHEIPFVLDYLNKL